MQLERRKGEELDKKIRISNGKLTETRTRLRGVDDTSEAKSRAKAMRTAEHRLDIIMGRLNQMVRSAHHGMPTRTSGVYDDPPVFVQSKTNDMHRTEIESLRLDKLQRQRIVRRLERDLAETRRRVGAAKSDAQSTTEGRDKAQRDISSLQALLEHEQAAFASELQARGSGGEDGG